MANLEALRKRALQRLTSLPELLYAVTRHWILITGMTAFGILILAAKVSTDTPMYEAKATLSLNIDDAVVVEQAKGVDLREQDAQKAFVTRVAQFSSDTVLRKLVNTIQPSNLLAQDENPEEPDFGPVRQLVSRFKRKINSTLEFLEHPRIQDFGEEREIQKAVSAFRRRSKVIPNPRTNTVLIQVFGTDRDLLEKELEQWIRVYIARLVEMAKETQDYYLNSRMEHWKEIEEGARRDLDAFRKANPEVSKATQDLLVRELVQLEDRRDKLQRQIDDGETAPADDLEVETPELQALLAEKREVEADRRKHGGFAPGSEKMRPLNEHLRSLEEKIEEVRARSGYLPRGARPKPEEQLTKAVTAIETVKAKSNALLPKLEELGRLDGAYERALQTRDKYVLMSLQALDLRESTRYVQATVIEKPQVSWTPYETYPYRQVLYGGAAGLAAGVLLTLIFELFRSTVRFKSDIETQFPVRVVGVIPLR